MSDEAIRVIRDRLAEHEFRASECRAMLTLLGADPEDAPAAPEPEPEPEPTPPEREDPRRGKPLEAVARLSLAERPKAPKPAAQPGGSWAARILAFVGEHGPQRTGDLEKRFGVTGPAFVGQMKGSGWFEKARGNRLGPWGLSEAGRAALKAQQSPPATSTA